MSEEFTIKDLGDYTLCVGSAVISPMEYTRSVGQEWCRPPAGMSIDGLVTIDTMRGPLVLCNVEQWQRGWAGGIRRVPVQYAALAEADPIA